MNSLCLLTPSDPVLATLHSPYVFLKAVCIPTGNRDHLKFLSDWVAHQDFFMTNEFFSLLQTFIIKAIVSPRRGPCVFNN